MRSHGSETLLRTAPLALNEWPQCSSLDRTLDRRLSRRISAPSGGSRRTPRLTTRATCARSRTSSKRGNLADWKRVDSQHVRVFAARAHAGGLSPRSVQRRLSAVRGFFDYLVRERVGRQQSRRWTSARPRPRGACPARSMSTRSTSCSTFRRDDALAVRDRAIMELFYSSGLRLDELVGLDIAAARSRRPHGARARQGSQDAHRAGGPQGRARRCAPGCASAARSPTSDETALFVGTQRRAPQAARHPAAHRVLGAAQGPAEPRLSAPVPAFIRHASA